MTRTINKSWINRKKTTKIILFYLFAPEINLKCFFNKYFQLKYFCNVKYRKFNYNKYAKHVRNLRNYAFKAVIIQVS